MAVLVIVAGWSLIAASPLLAVYACLLALAFHLRVVYYEEPHLARSFPREWELYRATVGRWWPTFTRH